MAIVQRSARCAHPSSLPRIDHDAAANGLPGCGRGGNGFVIGHQFSDLIAAAAYQMETYEFHAAGRDIFLTYVSFVTRVQKLFQSTASLSTACTAAALKDLQRPTVDLTIDYVASILIGA